MWQIHRVLFEIITKRSNKKYLYQSDSLLEQSLMSDLIKVNSGELRKASTIPCCKVIIESQDDRIA